MRRLQLKALAICLAAALVAAGCGDGESDSGSSYGGGSSIAESTGGGRSYSYGDTTAQTATPAEAEGKATVSVGRVPELGRVLVDADGLTLYDFHKDRGAESACYGACAEQWPPLLTKGAPRPGDGAASSRLGTAQRRDGTTQVTYAGHPLYTFAADTEAGEANGNGLDTFGGEWYALTPRGTESEG